MKLLGLHAYSSNSSHKLHNTGVAMIEDGQILAAVDEERYSRQKNDGSFPSKSLQDIFNITGISPAEVDYVVMPDVSNFKQLYYVSKYVAKTFFETNILLSNYWKKVFCRSFEIRKIPDIFPKAKKIYVEHHYAHAASAYYTSPWDKATIITVDGMGDYSMSGIIALGINGKINVLKKLNGFYSPGLFYSMITDYLGFVAGRHEGKITGLASYTQVKDIHKYEDLLTFDKQKMDFYSSILPYEINRYSFEYGIKNKLYLFDKSFRDKSKEEVAAIAQALLEKSITKLIREIIKKTGEKKLVLAGGVFANVKLNQVIRELPCVDDIYICPAMSDSGLSVGAPLYFYYNKLNNTYVPKALSDVFLGRQFSDDYIENLLKKKKINYYSPENIENEIARLLSEGKIVAHYNGRMEYGPRALGNRSILVRATDSAVNRYLNDKLKRTEFMPFAPILLQEDAHEYLQDWKPDDIAAKFMTITYKVTPKMKETSPAVVHVDGTARPQVVNNEQQRLYNILKEYKKLTGIPVLINTSFNLHEEPIVNTPEEALSILHKEVVDVLILNDYIIKSE